MITDNVIAKAHLEGVSKADKAQLKKSKGLLFVGIEQRYPKAMEFKSIVHLINDSFGECVFLLADTLQRYSIGIDNPDIGKNELSEISAIKGQIWLHNSALFIQKLSIPYSISSWQDWLLNKDFNKFSFFVNELKKHDAEYRAAVNFLVTTFIKENERQFSDHAINLLQRYICEASAVACLAVNSGYQFILGPSRYNKPLALACKKLLERKVKYRALTYCVSN